jgi:hypothetical protein
MPRVFVPRVFAPRVRVPRAFAPHAFVPCVFVPRAFAPCLSDAEPRVLEGACLRPAPSDSPRGEFRLGRAAR